MTWNMVFSSRGRKKLKEAHLRHLIEQKRNMLNNLVQSYSNNLQHPDVQHASQELDQLIVKAMHPENKNGRS
ncbi:aspartyl-phosphate phosphatase Spo0E family protein [Paenibacillus pinisoli]|uniref:Aspartyl-phosphate phosphatase Spo0E family protein n=1 Tax=Paenibacillus pinisoli TaxID=1276110 RepID=A0A3A6PIA3_9BACL|nr:aspartyl-phosphate phosphatase Spo0E family protein [Paenibacillus pinisoli]